MVRYVSCSCPLSLFCWGIEGTGGIYYVHTYQQTFLKGIISSSRGSFATSLCTRSREVGVGHAAHTHRHNNLSGRDRRKKLLTDVSSFALLSTVCTAVYVFLDAWLHLYSDLNRRVAMPTGGFTQTSLLCSVTSVPGEGDTISGKNHWKACKNLYCCEELTI